MHKMHETATTGISLAVFKNLRSHFILSQYYYYQYYCLKFTQNLLDIEEKIQGSFQEIMSGNFHWALESNLRQELVSNDANPRYAFFSLSGCKEWRICFLFRICF